MQENAMECGSATQLSSALTAALLPLVVATISRWQLSAELDVSKDWVDKMMLINTQRTWPIRNEFAHTPARGTAVLRKTL